MTTRRQILAASVVGAALAAPVLPPEAWGQGRREEGVEAVSTPERFGAVGDGTADDTDAIVAWIRAPGAVKAAPPGRIYRITRTLDLTGSGPFDLDFGGSVLKLAHAEPLRDDRLTVYGLHLPGRHALRNVVIEGLGREAMQSGAITPPGEGAITWENVWFRDLQRRAFHLRTDGFTGMGTIRVTDCQTFPGPLPEGYEEGAGRFNTRGFAIDRLWGEGGAKRCFAFGDPLHDGSRDAIEGGFVGHVYVPQWETLGHSGQALYANFANNITFARVDVLDYHCDVSSNAVYFSRDCRDITVLSAHIRARGHPLTTALNIGGAKRVRVANAYLRSEGRVLRIEGHRDNHFASEIEVEGVFHCHIPEGRTLVEPPILLRNNTLGSGPDRDLRSATVRGRCLLTGRGAIVPPDDRAEQSARGCFLMVGSCTGTVTLDRIAMELDRADVIPIGVGSTGDVARVTVRDMEIRTAGQPALAAWKGEVRVQGGSVEGAEATAVWTPPGSEASCRVMGLDAWRSRIALSEGRGHVVTGCIATAMEVEDGIAAENLALP
jgi:hypothetical protein